MYSPTIDYFQGLLNVLVHGFIRLNGCLSVFVVVVFIYLFIYLFICLFVCLFIYLYIFI